MIMLMNEEIKRRTARRKTALILKIIQGMRLACTASGSDRSII